MPTPDALAPPLLPKLDGRRTHVIDRALDYVALADQGLSASRIARRRRRSQGYVSIVLRLGRAIQGMEPGEIAALRSPRVTWKLAQRIVRQDADVVSVRHQLRAALGGFSTHNVDGRKHRKGRRAATDPQRATGVAWGWDAAWFARDPLGYAESHLRYLVGLQRSVRSRAVRTTTVRNVERVSVGQSIRSLQRSLQTVTAHAHASALASTQADAPHIGHASDVLPPPEQGALAILDILDRKLGEASVEIEAILAERPAASPRPAGRRLPGPSDPPNATDDGPSWRRARLVRSEVLSEDLSDVLEDDLRD